MEADTDGLLSAMLNGTLDVAKDRVLKHGPDTDDDSFHIKKGFWTELYFSEQQTASIPDIFTEDSRLDAHVEDATQRWVSPRASRNARIRIAELVRYKLHLELSLRSFFVGTFTDPAHGAGSAPSVRYRDGMKNTTSKLREEIDESMDTLASAIR